MSGTKIRNLNISLNERDAIEKISFNSKAPYHFYISVNFNEIDSVKFIDESVLVIKFGNGEVRLDMTQAEFYRLASDNHSTRGISVEI